MRKQRLLGALLCAACTLAAAASCSDANDDAVGAACRVIVQCHAARSMSDCIDEIMPLPPDCVDCIAQSGCGYAACQVTPSGCRLPLDLMMKPMPMTTKPSPSGQDAGG